MGVDLVEHLRHAVGRGLDDAVGALFRLDDPVGQRTAHAGDFLAHPLQRIAIFLAHLVEAAVHLGLGLGLAQCRFGAALALGEAAVDGAGQLGDFLAQLGHRIALAAIGLVHAGQRPGQRVFQPVEARFGGGAVQRIGKLGTGIGDRPRHIVGQPIETAFQIDRIVGIAGFQLTQPVVQPRHRAFQRPGGLVGNALGALDAGLQRFGGGVQLAQRLRRAVVALAVEIGEILGARFQPGQACIQGFRCGAAVLVDGMQAGGGVVLMLIEPACQLHDRGFDRLGIGRAALRSGGLDRADAIGQLVLALADAFDTVLGGLELGAVALAGLGDLVGELGDRLVETGQGAGGEFFGGFHAFGEPVHHGAQQLVLLLVDGLAAAETGKGLQRIVPLGLGRIGFFQDDAIDPLAESEALAARSRFRPRPSAGIDPFHAPRTTGRHFESLAQPNRSRLFCG